MMTARGAALAQDILATLGRRPRPNGSYADECESMIRKSGYLVFRTKLCATKKLERRSINLNDGAQRRGVRL